jgi:hypothetical protein
MKAKNVPNDEAALNITVAICIIVIYGTKSIAYNDYQWAIAIQRIWTWPAKYLGVLLLKRRYQNESNVLAKLWMKVKGVETIINNPGVSFITNLSWKAHAFNACVHITCFYALMKTCQTILDYRDSK